MNRALPEMLHCLNTSVGNLAGNCTDLTVLDRQRTRIKWQQEQFQQQQQQQQQQNYFASQGQQLQGLINGDLRLDQVVTRSLKVDPGLENGWPDYGKFPLPKTGFCEESTGFESAGYLNGSAFEMNYAISRTASCPPAVAEAVAAVADGKGKESIVTEKLSSAVGKESFKKRKADKAQNSKVVAEDDSRDKRIKGCAEEEDSKMTEQNSSKNNSSSNSKNNNNNRENSGDTSKENSKVSEVQKPDYIHVRARRGQATDSHSLAERVRREKISERMKYLQDLVPGCNKITGKAGMLDEIINYVQSLQRQVEFLSMKLAAVNPRLDFNIDNFFAKEVFPACTASFPTLGATSSEMANPALLQLNQLQQVISCCGLEMGMINPPDMGLRRTTSAPVSFPENFLDTSYFNQIQPSTTWDADLQNLFGVDIHQGRSTPFPSQPFTDNYES
ncbi:hypothetical protein L1049_014918 [Liquidambar formosana]|uniref:BHLH domain-containing protein n=1 Tax=Liquidambar formosana TaxID=63359 RepID=A0AAP0S412_LIQFO